MRLRLIWAPVFPADSFLSGGFWNAIPFNDSAQAQSDIPPLNEPCMFGRCPLTPVSLLFDPSPLLAGNYETNLINGVNLGGCVDGFMLLDTQLLTLCLLLRWLLLEPFISPSLFEPFNPTTDTLTGTYTVIDGAVSPTTVRAMALTMLLPQNGVCLLRSGQTCRL